MNCQSQVNERAEMIREMDLLLGFCLQSARVDVILGD